MQKEKGKRKNGLFGLSMAGIFFLLPFAFCLASFAADRPAQPSARVWHAVLNNGFSLRHARHEELGAITRLYLGADDVAGYVDVPTAQVVRFEQDEFAYPAPETAAPIPPPTAIPDLINAAGDRHRIDSDFLLSVVRAESDFNARAVSPKGAQGLMQLMPATAMRLGVGNSFDAAANIEGGTRYLRELLEQYRGDPIRALAAYNAGPHRVRQYGGVPPYRETRAYVSRIIRDFNRRKEARVALDSAAHSVHRGRGPSPRSFASQKRLAQDDSTLSEER